MLQIIADLEMMKIIQRINKCMCYSLQVDGSLDRSQSDNKFTTLRFIEPDGAIQSVFLDVSAPTQNGARGLLKATIEAIKKLVREKLASLTTDGESANSGPDESLWKLLEEELGRKLLTVWCTLEDMEDEVLELTKWKSNAVALSTYFRTSKCRTKLLYEFGMELGVNVPFPAHNEIRFAEHGEHLLKSIIRNLPVCKKVWQAVVQSNCYDYTRSDRLKASNFLSR